MLQTGKRGTRLVLLCAAASLIYPATANARKPLTRNPAASIEYNLPITTAKISMDLTLKQCGTEPKAVPAVTILPVANPNPAREQRFRLYGADLESFSKKREVSIELYPSGGIKSFNGGSADRTGAIVTNVIKSVAGLVMLAADTSGSAPLAAPLTCTSETLAALRQADTLEARIKSLRGDFVTATPANAAAIGEAITSLASELGRLRAGPLSLKLQRELSFFEGSRGAVIQWKRSELSKWFGEPLPSSAGDPVALFGLAYCVDRLESALQPAAARCSVQAAQAFQQRELDAQTQPPAPKQAPCADTGCHRSIVFREPVEARLTLVSMGKGLADLDAGKPVASGDLQIAQWGRISEFPLSAAFGSSRNLSLGMNEFGKRTSFGWKSDARLENITGGAASAVEATGTLVGAFQTDLEEMQAEALELETEQKLYKLKKCREIQAAGGACPS